MSTPLVTQPMRIACFEALTKWHGESGKLIRNDTNWNLAASMVVEKVLGLYFTQKELKQVTEASISLIVDTWLDETPRIRKFKDKPAGSVPLAGFFMYNGDKYSGVVEAQEGRGLRVINLRGLVTVEQIEQENVPPHIEEAIHRLISSTADVAAQCVGLGVTGLFNYALSKSMRTGFMVYGEQDA